MSIIKLLPPCSYQGGKQRLANQICDIIEERESSDFVFYDLCCGSGAVSIEMVNRDYEVVMVDKAPFGLFYEMIGKGIFDLSICLWCPYYVGRVLFGPSRWKQYH